MTSLRLNSGPQPHTKMSSTEALCQLFSCFPVTCIPFLNTLLEMLKQRPESSSQGLPTMSGKAVEDPLALCPCSRACSARSRHSTGLFWEGSSSGLRCFLPLAEATVSWSHCTAQLRGLPPCSSCCPSAPAQQCNESSCPTALALQHPGKWIYCRGSKDKLKTKK